LRRPLRQAQLRPAAPGGALLARQPVAQRRHQVVVRQLVTRARRTRCRRRLLAGGPALGVGRRDQPQLGVEDAQQLAEIGGPPGGGGGPAKHPPPPPGGPLVGAPPPPPPPPHPPARPAARA